MPTRLRALAVFTIALATSACQTVMPLEEARRVTASFAGRPFVPPPRTVHDVIALLDQFPQVKTDAAKKARALVDQPPPVSSDPDRLAGFYHQRALAARELGRFRQELADLERAAGYSRTLPILDNLSNAQLSIGNLAAARAIREEMLGFATPGFRLSSHALLARILTIQNDFVAADEALYHAQKLLRESRGWQNALPESVASWEALVANALAGLYEARGHLDDAEPLYRKAIAVLEADPKWSKDPWVEVEVLRLAYLFVRQGRLLEAESEARKALLSVLRKRGRDYTVTATALRVLARTVGEQGRYAEAEMLARAGLRILTDAGAPADSVATGLARAELAAALVGQRRWAEAAGEYDRLERFLGGTTQTLDGVAAFGVRTNQSIALLKSGRLDDAVAVLTASLERHRAVLGRGHAITAETQGLLAAAHTARGDVDRALAAFPEATRILLDRPLAVDEEMATRAARDQRLRVILGSYIRLLASIRGTDAERRAGLDATAEAFRLADAARRASVQRSLDAAAARAAAKTTVLADLVRSEQDASKQIGALLGTLAGAMTSSGSSRPASRVALQTELETLQRARHAIRQQIEREFPNYAQLITPAPLTLDDARHRLRAGEALIATYVDDDQTVIWAVPHSGPVALTSAPLGQRSLEDLVSALRTSLDPSARTLGEIPDFDLGVAHRLYATLLAPVAAGWRHADSLLIVADGPLGQVPFALLPTRAAALAPEQGLLFSGYQAVPWLIRSHAVTVLPSVTTLATLRSLPVDDARRQPFIGFGDPVFGPQHADPADAAATLPTLMALTARGRPLSRRSSSNTLHLDSSRLAMLPRLPDTADELRSIAAALGADVTRHVVTGPDANEKTVKGLDLTPYRVLAFATHGLVPGELDGLTQPALALSAPEVAGIDGDGLLTMQEILGLRLNADWVVLSACNTGSGHGAGSEAVSGLGRAFFYAGARALLVSNWPVETTSARELTTDVFRRQTNAPELTRARALQQAMNALIDSPGFVDHASNTAIFSYAHPIFWAPFSLVGDGGGR